MPRFRLTLEYDGTEFLGWQAQRAGARTVQGTLEAAVAELFGGAPTVTGAGRTDAGVHAEGQVASFAVGTDLAGAAIQKALNARLPDDLAVLACQVVGEDFDPRREACSKLYRYAVWNGPERSPLRRRRFHRVPGSLDLEAMAEAARGFEGTHDFASLQSTGSSVQTSVRTLLRCELEAPRPGHEVRLHVEGTGFLRHMVRCLAGTVIEVGRGQRPAGSIAGLLAASDRGAAGPTAPARGLTLVAVRYPADSSPSADSPANSGP